VFRKLLAPTSEDKGESYAEAVTTQA